MRAALLRAIVAASGFALGALPAWADVTFTYTGIVYYGFDQSGIFGTPNTLLGGDAFTLTYTSDGEQIVWNNNIDSLGPVTMSLTIKGHTYSLATMIDSIQITGNYVYYQAGMVFYQGSAANGESDVNFYALGRAAPATLEQSFSYSFNGSSDSDTLESGGLFYYCTPCGQDGQVLNYAYLESFNSNFSEVGFIPEPSTWAMMLLGFAGLGWVGYRRRNARLA